MLKTSKKYLYNIFHIHSSQFLMLMAQKPEEIMPGSDAIIRLRRDRLLSAKLTGATRVGELSRIRIPRELKRISTQHPCYDFQRFFFFGIYCIPVRVQHPSTLLWLIPDAFSFFQSVIMSTEKNRELGEEWD